MKSFNRIKKILETVEEVIDRYNFNDCTVADIATDHGYLSELLSRNEKISKIYATDISSKCLDKTDKLIKDFHLDKIETRQGDGLTVIDRADIVVMAGIGGYEIIKILSNQNITKNNEKKCSIFVLQPTKNCVELRRWIIENQFLVVKDKIIKSSGKFYPIIVIDESIIDGLEDNIFNVYFGRDNTNELDFVEYLKDVVQKLSFVEKIQENKDKLSNEIITKIQVYNLAKNLLKKFEGE